MLSIGKLTVNGLNNLWKPCLLFAAGASFTLLHKLIILQRPSTLNSEQWVDFLLEEWWLPPLVGALAATLGLLCPSLEEYLGKSPTNTPDWSGVLRCSALFVGINHASAKVDYPSELQLTFTLAALCAALWWTFDRSAAGLTAGLGSAIFASLLHIWVSSTVPALIRPPERLKLWLPFVVFSGGITVVTMGRRIIRDGVLSAKAHTD